MSGHFLLLNIDSHEREEALAHQATWSDAVQHAPWSAESRAELRAAQRGEQVIRKKLPPHCYLECAYAYREQLGSLFAHAGWLTKDRLSRPVGGDAMGLKRLDAAAQEAWDQGKVREALILQLNNAYDVTLEIYYLDGAEIVAPAGQVARTAPRGLA
jgi:hypothetical protein